MSVPATLHQSTWHPLRCPSGGSSLSLAANPPCPCVCMCGASSLAQPCLFSAPLRLCPHNAIMLRHPSGLHLCHRPSGTLRDPQGTGVLRRCRLRSQVASGARLANVHAAQAAVSGWTSPTCPRERVIAAPSPLAASGTIYMV